MKRPHVLASIVAAAALIFAAPGRAVCFYPQSTLSGYRVPLKLEVRKTPVILVGKVTKVHYIQGDPADPIGITAMIYSVDVLQILKGSVPKQVKLYADNDSGGYRMSVGETDLLFLTKDNGIFSANACGNSAVLPGSKRTLALVRRLLALHTQQP